MKDKIRIEFIYENDFGNITELRKVLDSTDLDESELEIIVKEFKRFLVCASFQIELINRINIQGIEQESLHL